MNHNRKPCFTSKQGLFYLFDAMGMFGAVGTREGFFLRFATKASHRSERPANSLAGNGGVFIG